MAATTLLSMRDRIRQRTDNEHSTFVSDAELTQLVNTYYKELYGLLVRYSIQRAETTSTITATGASSYNLPGDFYSLVAVFRTEGNTEVLIPRHGERFRTSAVTGAATSYRIVNSTIEFFPRPSSGTYKVVYIPVPADLSADADTLDGVLGWEELVVINAAIKVLQKEEAETEALRADKAEILRRIQDEAAAVEFTENWVVENVRSRSRYSAQADLMEGLYLDRRGLRGWRW